MYNVSFHVKRHREQMLLWRSINAVYNNNNNNMYGKHTALI